MRITTIKYIGLGLLVLAVALGVIVMAGNGVTAQVTPDYQIPQDSNEQPTTQPAQQPVQPQSQTEPAQPQADATEQPAADTFPETMPAPMVLDVENDSSVLLRGAVASVNQDSMTVDGWGGPWTVRIDASGTVVTDGITNVGSFSGIETGDFVGVEGTMAGDADFTVEASFVRNWTTDPFPGAFEGGVTEPTSTLSPDTDAGITSPDPVDGSPEETPLGTQAESFDNAGLDNTDDDAGNTDTDAEGMDETMASSWSGTVESVNGDTSLTFISDTGVIYEADTSAAELVDEDGESIRMEDIDAGDDVVVDGTLEEETVQASRIEVDTSFF